MKRTRQRREDALNDPKVRRSCDGKKPFPSKRAALGTVRCMKADGASRPGYELQAYKCRGCHRWHVGNSRRRSTCAA